MFAWPILTALDFIMSFKLNCSNWDRLLPADWYERRQITQAQTCCHYGNRSRLQLNVADVCFDIGNRRNRIGKRERERTNEEESPTDSCAAWYPKQCRNHGIVLWQRHMLLQQNTTEYIYNPKYLNHSVGNMHQTENDCRCHNAHLSSFQPSTAFKFNLNFADANIARSTAIRIIFLTTENAAILMPHQRHGISSGQQINWKNSYFACITFRAKCLCCTGWEEKEINDDVENGDGGGGRRQMKEESQGADVGTYWTRKRNAKENHNSEFRFLSLALLGFISVVGSLVPLRHAMASQIGFSSAEKSAQDAQNWSAERPARKKNRTRIAFPFSRRSEPIVPY